MNEIRTTVSRRQLPPRATRTSRTLARKCDAGERLARLPTSFFTRYRLRATHHALFRCPRARVEQTRGGGVFYTHSRGVTATAASRTTPAHSVAPGDLHMGSMATYQEKILHAAHFLLLPPHYHLPHSCLAA